MNKLPLVEMLAFFSRYQVLEQPVWRKQYTCQLKEVRSCHSKTDGGVKRSFFTVETRGGAFVNLVFDEEELLWTLERKPPFSHHIVDRVLALVKRHKHMPSRAHRVIPYRFEIIPKEVVSNADQQTEPALIDRVQPYRFQSGKIPSTQVTKVMKRETENLMITKHLHYLVKTDLQRLFHLYFVLDEGDWRFAQEVDEAFFIYDNKKGQRDLPK